MGDMSDDADIIDNGPGVVDVPWDNVETGSKYLPISCRRAFGY